MVISRKASILVAVVLVLAGCAKATLQSEQPSTLAVWDVENLSPDPAGQPDLGEILSVKIIETIKSVGTHPVVERERLILVLEELNLGSSELADDATRLNVGALVGARFMVFGAYQQIGDLMRLDLRLVRVETGKIVSASQRTVTGSNLSAWIEATEAATRELID